jgi:hypothetical protein
MREREWVGGTILMKINRYGSIYPNEKAIKEEDN